MQKIIELFKITKKENNGDSMDLYDAHTKTPFTVYKEEVTETVWNDLKALRKGSVYGLRHTDTTTTLILGFSANTKTDF